MVNSKWNNQRPYSISIYHSPFTIYRLEEMTTYHPDLAAGRWFTFSIAEQLGNVGSEYERARSWKERGDKDRFEHAFARLLELLDLTIADPRWKNHRLKELTRLREVICDELYNDTPEFMHPSDLRQYFLYFGILARSERDKAMDTVTLVNR